MKCECEKKSPVVVSLVTTDRIHSIHILDQILIMHPLDVAKKQTISISFRLTFNKFRKVLKPHNDQQKQTPRSHLSTHIECVKMMWLSLITVVLVGQQFLEHVTSDKPLLPVLILFRLGVHCMMHHITSHHITSHHIASHHITSHRITSHHITSHHITSHHITSHHITSHHITSHHITSHPSHHITSHHITPHRIISQHRTSNYHSGTPSHLRRARTHSFLIITNYGPQYRHPDKGLVN